MSKEICISHFSLWSKDVQALSSPSHSFPNRPCPFPKLWRPFVSDGSQASISPGLPSEPNSYLNNFLTTPCAQFLATSNWTSLNGTLVFSPQPPKGITSSPSSRNGLSIQLEEIILTSIFAFSQTQMHQRFLFMLCWKDILHVSTDFFPFQIPVQFESLSSLAWITVEDSHLTPTPFLSLSLTIQTPHSSLIHLKV